LVEADNRNGLRGRNVIPRREIWRLAIGKIGADRLWRRCEAIA
jgi:hypothetical protein